MPSDHRHIVQQGYDQIAEKYLSWSGTRPSPRERYTDELLKRLPLRAKILELGCGAGVPVTQMLISHGVEVVGNDISSRQLELAKARCPQADFVCGDMSTLELEPASFDGVVGFFTLFHLPRGEQRPMLERILSWLKDDGVLVANLGTTDEAEMRNDFFGTEMFWSSYDVEDSKAMIRDVGFELIEAEVLGSGDGLDSSDPDYGVQFLWFIARKAKGAKAS